MANRFMVRFRTDANLFQKKAFPLFLALALFASHSVGASAVSGGEAQSDRPASGAPQRIVVFPLFAEEMLLEMVGPGRIVYVGHEYYENGETYSPTMELTKNIQGRYWDMTDEEEILALNPDLIVLNLDYAKAFPLLYQANIPLLMLETPKSVDGIRGALAILGAEVGAPEKAAQMAEEMDAGLAQIKETVSAIPDAKRVSAVFYEYWNSEDDDSTCWYRQDSFIMTARAAGVVPLGPDTTDFIDLSADDLLTQQNPDLITYDYTDYDTDGSVYDITGHRQWLARELLGDPALASVTAIRNHALYPIRICESQFIVQSALALARLAYPDLFPAED